MSTAYTPDAYYKHYHDYKDLKKNEDNQSKHLINLLDSESTKVFEIIDENLKAHALATNTNPQKDDGDNLDFILDPDTQSKPNLQLENAIDSNVVINRGDKSPNETDQLTRKTSQNLISPSETQNFILK